MQVVILAGGLGTRLRPLTDRVPKVLVAVRGKPFLKYQLEWLANHCLTDIVICVGHLGDRLSEFAGDGRAFGVSIKYSSDGSRLLGTGGALKKAETLLDEDFCVLNGDSYLPIDPLEPIRYFREEQHSAMMLIFHNNGSYDRSNVAVKDGMVTLYDRNSTAPEVEYIDYGLRMFRRDTLKLVPQEGPWDLEVLYQKLIKQNQLRAYPVDEPFYEIGKAEGLERFARYLSQSGPGQV